MAQITGCVELIASHQMKEEMPVVQVKYKI